MDELERKFRDHHAVVFKKEKQELQVSTSTNRIIRTCLLKS